MRYPDADITLFLSFFVLVNTLLDQKKDQKPLTDFTACFTSSGLRQITEFFDSVISVFHCIVHCRFVNSNLCARDQRITKDKAKYFDKKKKKKMQYKKVTDFFLFITKIQYS